MRSFRKGAAQQPAADGQGEGRLGNPSGNGGRGGKFRCARSSGPDCVADDRTGGAAPSFNRAAKVCDDHATSHDQNSLRRNGAATGNEVAVRLQRWSDGSRPLSRRDPIDSNFGDGFSLTRSSRAERSGVEGPPSCTSVPTRRFAGCLDKLDVTE